MTEDVFQKEAAGGACRERGEAPREAAQTQARPEPAPRKSSTGTAADGAQGRAGLRRTLSTYRAKTDLKQREEETATAASSWRERRDRPAGTAGASTLKGKSKGFNKEAKSGD